MQINFQSSLVESNFVWLHSFANGFFPGSTVRWAKDYSWFHAQCWDSNLKHSIDVMYALGKANWTTFYLVRRTIFFWLGLIACFSHNSLRLCVQVVSGWAWNILSARCYMGRTFHSVASLPLEISRLNVVSVSCLRTSTCRYSNLNRGQMLKWCWNLY